MRTNTRPTITTTLIFNANIINFVKKYLDTNLVPMEIAVYCIYIQGVLDIKQYENRPIIGKPGDPLIAPIEG